MLNHITIMGRLTRDPELRRTGSGIAVANFTLAVERDFASKEGAERETDFIDCVAWRQDGEFISKHFTKGRMAVVSGRLEIRTWKDKENNNRRSAEVVVDNIYFADSKRDNAKQAAPQAGGNEPAAPAGGTPGGYAPPAPPAASAAGFGGGYGANAGYPPYGNGFAPAYGIPEDNGNGPF